jgi:hypothetical protein
MVHTRHYLPLPDMLRCPRSSLRPISDLGNTPLLVQKYIHISFVLCHYLVSFGFATRFILLLLTCNMITTIIRHSYPFRPIYTVTFVTRLSQTKKKQRV